MRGSIAVLQRSDRGLTLNRLKSNAGCNAILPFDHIASILSQLDLDQITPDVVPWAIPSRWGMGFLRGYTLPWTRLRNSPYLGFMHVAGTSSSQMSIHLRCFTKQKSRPESETEKVKGMKVHRESGRFPQPGLVEETRFIEQVQEMRASVAMHTTITEIPAIWTIVWMLDKSGFELDWWRLGGHFMDAAWDRAGCLSGFLIFIRTIDFILGGHPVIKGWKGMLSEWEDVVQTLEDESRVPVGAPNHQNLLSLQQLMIWVIGSYNSG